MQSKNEWLKSIAEKVNLDISIVENVLATHKITPSPVVAQPRRLSIRKLEFSGVKDSTSHSGPFKFCWNNLENGLWAILSEKNFRGKSTIIEVVRWMLRGKPSDTLQEDVRRWINSIQIIFQLDSEEYEIIANTSNDITGSLSRIRTLNDNKKKQTVLAEFISDSEFELVMSDFFMRMFSMTPLSTLRKNGPNDVYEVTHGWASLSGAMFIGTDYKVLLGDMPVNAGLTSRMMQMYLGIPWVSTLASVKTAHKIVETAIHEQKRKNEQNRALTNERANIINAEISAKKSILNDTPNNDDLLIEIQTKTKNLISYRNIERELIIKQEIAEAEFRQIDIIHKQDRNNLQTHNDAVSAKAIFRSLDPKCCPRCDHTISNERKKQESLNHECFICGEKTINSEDTEAIREELINNVHLSEKALKTCATQKEKIKDELLNLQKKIDLLQINLNSISENFSLASDRQTIITEIAVLEGRLDELSIISKDNNDDDIDRASELNILSVTVKETEKLVKDLQGDLLADISIRLVKYANTFGMKNLSFANLKGNVTLNLTKGGTKTSYSKVTDGEKLRLKVATILAMIEVAEEKGIGRHPGLLMIDSPGAQEVSSSDLEQLIAGLQLVANKSPHFQIFIAGITSKAITDHVEKSNRYEATVNEYLW